MLITSNTDFSSFIRRASKERVLAIDTEFVRESTYRPQLCLLQLGTPSEAVAVDPFRVNNIYALEELFQNKDIVKVFHAGHQDLEILFHEFELVPEPVFDTQIAAAVLGIQEQAGYGYLVKEVLNITLAKTESLTDWAKRPLSDVQLSYAEDDVLYLPQMYEILLERLQTQGKVAWADLQVRKLVESSQETIDPRLAYLHVNRSASLSRIQLSALRELAAWREVTAQERNVIRKRVISDDDMIAAVKKAPYTVDALYEIRSIKYHVPLADAREIVRLIRYGQSLPPEQFPELPAKTKNEVNVDGLVDLMSSLVRYRAKELNTTSSLLANREELKEFARGHYEESGLMEGWKKEAIGLQLKGLMEGKLALTCARGHVVVQEIDSKK